VLGRFQQLQISIATLKHPRWLKLDNLFNAKANTLKQTLLIRKDTRRKLQKKYNWVASRKGKALSL
jgi:hypothetical protein